MNIDTAELINTSKIKDIREWEGQYGKWGYYVRENKSQIHKDGKRTNNMLTTYSIGLYVTDELGQYVYSDAPHLNATTDTAANAFALIARCIELFESRL